MQLLSGFLLASIVAYAAHRVHSLDRSGAIAATVVGTVIFGIGGWQWSILLLTFFMTSSGLSRAFKRHKAGLDEKFSKGHERDAGQVLGNGGLATIFAALHAVYPESTWPWIGFAASLAAVNADAPSDAYPILGLRYVPTGARGLEAGCQCEGWGVGRGLPAEDEPMAQGKRSDPGVHR